jgi:Asp-tRNA(Asn)/Glu-tRNA(Gln) amidotransferase C subunit
LHKAIPPKPIEVPTELPELKKIDHDTILQLERVALVNLGNEEGARRLAAAIQLADTIAKVDTRGVQPLYTVLEDRYVTLSKINRARLTENNFAELCFWLKMMS